MTEKEEYIAKVQASQASQKEAVTPSDQLSRKWDNMNAKQKGHSLNHVRRKQPVPTTVRTTIPTK